MSLPELPKTTATQAGIAAAKALSEPVLRVKRVNPDAKLPTRGSAEAAGYDLHSVGDWELPPGVVVAIATGLIIEIPRGHVGLIRDRSGLASKGITTYVVRANREAFRSWIEEMDEASEQPLGGVVDSDYRGEWRVLLLNTTDKPIRIAKGDRVAQFVVLPLAAECQVLEVAEVTAVTETRRGEGGFGSTGR